MFAVAATELALSAPRGVAPLDGRGDRRAAAVAPPPAGRARAGVLAAIGLQSSLFDLDSFPLGDILAMVVATYAIGAYAERRWALAGLGLIAAGARTPRSSSRRRRGRAARRRGPAVDHRAHRARHRALTREGRQRSLEIERSRAREARAAVTSERMRVARELHDAVAHNISVIAIQAGGADGIVERDPARAEQCVELIETVAREALAELGRLARPQAAEDDAGEPSLARVDQLADRARAAGVPVELSVEGRPAALHAGVDLAAFRIVQEALANAAKHARANRA